MRVPLKGINRVRKRLKNGQVRTYYYAWKGGPRLEGSPGSPEFIAGYYKAIETRRRQPSATVSGLISRYSGSPQFNDLARSTKKDYAKHLLAIEREFGDLPLNALEDKRVRGEFLAWRDRNAARSRRQADYGFAVLARLLSWSRDRGLILVNPCERGGRVYRPERSNKVWTEADEKAFLAKAPAHLHLALKLALWTGQRQGDLRRLTWSQFDGDVIRLRQEKGRVRVEIPVGQGLKPNLLYELQRVQKDHPESWPTRPVLRTQRDQPWTEGGFRASWRKACILAGIKGVTFHDLRGTAVTRLALAGCTVPEIATISGHSLRDVGSILDAHYLNRSSSLARTAIGKLEKSFSI